MRGFEAFYLQICTSVESFRWRIFRHAFLPIFLRIEEQLKLKVIFDQENPLPSDHHRICDMEGDMSTTQRHQKSPAYSSHRPRSIAPSNTGPAHKPHHSADPLKRHKISAAGQSSKVFGSRIEKNRTNPKKQIAYPSGLATASTSLIRVLINNRLGTKTEIPCSPTDTIEAFKRLAAVYMGTRPEALLLKRQGERPLKDFLTLEDYGISNGSSLDLEVDTGDE